MAVNEDEIPALLRLQANAAANGVELIWLSAAEVQAREPQVRAVAGLFSPLTGIVDSHALLQSFEAALQAADGELLCHTRVERISALDGGLELTGRSNAEGFSLRARQVVNAGGLFAQQLQAAAGAQQVPPLHLCQGRYFSYSGRSPFSHLVYPMPEANATGLGVHATLDLGGQLRLGQMCVTSTRWIIRWTRRCERPLPPLSPAIGQRLMQPGCNQPMPACAQAVWSGGTGP
ncbi:FAD-dependent oxidoreductase [Halopseudomonas pachastrellae]|nr:FAD-dependent oxidoreductase [Halopseudomonas pachastrellae]